MELKALLAKQDNDNEKTIQVQVGPSRRQELRKVPEKDAATIESDGIARAWETKEIRKAGFLRRWGGYGLVGQHWNSELLGRMFASGKENEWRRSAGIVASGWALRRGLA